MPAADDLCASSAVMLLCPAFRLAQTSHCQSRGLCSKIVILTFPVKILIVVIL
jgi:hypothetical protein